MEFGWTKEQRDLRKGAISFAKQENPENIEELDRESTFLHERWRTYAEFGAQGITAPESLGGQELDFLSCVAVMEGLGYGAKDSGLLFSINAHIWSFVEPLVTFGSEEQKTKYFPGACDGSTIGVHAMTEPGSGSDALNLTTTAELVGDYYVINGSKTFITNGEIADAVLVFVKTKNSDAENDKISAIIVERGTPGFTVSKNITKMGLRTSPFNELFFEQCQVPRENLVGEEGMGEMIFNHAMDGERAFILATQIGLMEKQLEDCTDYARKRKQFGKSISEFQSVSNMLAEMKVNLEAARMLVYKVGWLKSKGRNAYQDSSIAKLFVSECSVKNSMFAMKIHGGYGYTCDYKYERQLRDSMGGLFYSGTSEIMKNIIAELLE